MSRRLILRVVFVIAMAFSLSAPFGGTVAACDPGTSGLC
jgi:hypothetical protein